MISKTAQIFCREKISLIENYEQAIMDSKKWVLHHKIGLFIPVKKLKKLKLYYNRPAIELVFLTQEEHKRLHGKNKRQDTLLKLSESLIGHKPWNKGKHHSDETKMKMSESMKGIPKSKEHRKKISEYHKKPILQIDKQTGEIIKTWSCALEVQKVLEINRSSISQCCSGKQKSAGGYIWRYANNESLI